MTSAPLSHIPCQAAFAAAVLAILVMAGHRPADAAEAPSASAGQAAERVIAGLDSGDADLRAVALDTVRHGLTGEWFTRLVVERLPQLDPSRQRAVLLALADRGDPAAVAEPVAALATADDPAVRAATLRLLGGLGGAAEVPRLLAALAADGPVREAARRGLVEIRGAEAAAAIRSATSSGPAATRAIAIDVLAERRDRASLTAFAAAAAADDATVRRAALRALGTFGGAAEMPAMVRALLMSATGERAAGEAAIAAVCTASREAGPATDALVAEYRNADEADRRIILAALARVGGPQVMAIVDAMLADPATRARGLEALSKWPDASVKDRILDLAERTTDPDERQLLLDTLIRIAPLPDNKLDDRQRLELVKQTMTLCRRPEDKARVLERANAIRTIETFRFVAPYLDDPTLAAAACRSVVELAHHQKLRDAQKQEFMTALDKVLAISGDEELRERATRYKAGRTWDRAKKN